jgi:hypothetical protein
MRDDLVHEIWALSENPRMISAIGHLCDYPGGNRSTLHR